MTMAEANDRPNEARGWKPVPDPTELTSEALYRESARLNEQFVLRLQGAFDQIKARLDGMDEAQRLFQAGLNRVPSEVDTRVAALAALFDERFRSLDDGLRASALLQDERFKSIQTQFEERDTRVRETASMTKTAVDAALLAQQGAADKASQSFEASIAKIEAAFAKQIDAMAALIASSRLAADARIEDLKERMTRSEGLAGGQSASKSEQHQAGGANLAIIGTIISVVALLVTIALAVFAMTRGHG
jgi:hypothetical protein